MKVMVEVSLYLLKLFYITFYFVGVFGDKGRGIYVLYNSCESKGMVIVY